MRQNEHGQYVSDDGFWVWDGTQWVPAAQPAPAAPAATQPADDAATTTGHASSGSGTTAETPAETTAAYGAQTGGPVGAVHEHEAAQPATAQFTTEQPAAAQSTAAQSSAAQPATVAGPATAAGPAAIQPHVDRAHPLSPDGRHWWTGDEWVEVDTAALGADRPAADTHTLPQSSSAPAASLDLVSGGAGGTAVDRPPAGSAETTVDRPPAGAADATGERPATGATSAQHAGWQPETAAAPERQAEPAAQGVIPQGQRQRSPDGYWEWDGTQWVAANAERGANGRQLSPDGLWEWDGAQWVPAGGAVVEVPEGAHVSPDGHWWWNGTQWVPTGR